MIALLMLYSATAAVLCAVAAAWAERATLLAQRPARWTWTAAIVACCALPGLAAWRMRTPSDTGATLGILFEWLALLGGIGGAPGTVRPATAVAPSATIVGVTAALRSFDRPLAIVWALFALLALAQLVVRALLTRHVVRAQLRDPAARRYAVGRARALVTPTLGPAVLGGWRATLVLPRWTWKHLDPVRRRLVFAHEAEHLRAGDPRLLTVAAVLVALAPWSPAGWWMLARLRAAAELDCDRRVLARAGRRGSAPVAAYGTLLLDVAARHAAAPRPRPRLAPALAESAPTTLERRIRQMTAPRPTAARARLALLSLGTVACAAAACELPRPTGPRAATAVPLPSVAPGAASPQAPDLPRMTTSGTGRIASNLDSVLVVIDGRIAGRGARAIDSVAPASIASVDVLKGAAATARYGDAGRAGVIVIARKSGTP